MVRVMGTTCNMRRKVFSDSPEIALNLVMNLNPVSVVFGDTNS
jgi:hypothetical protein